MLFTIEDLKYFLDNIYDETFSDNEGGMCSCDMFTLYFSLKKIQPKVVIESGVWNGLSTKLIRKTLGDNVKIICLDPRDIPSYGFKDNNKNTTYLTGNNFIDFGNLNLEKYDKNNIFAFFDCHQNALNRLLQCSNKNIKYLFFNDNYPINCGSHYTLEHFKNNDNRYNIININKKNEILNLINKYYIFPNIYPGDIKTGEGLFSCESFFEKEQHLDKFYIFKKDISKYRWNTYVELK